MATIQVEQPFKGFINDVSFEKEEVMMTTAAIVEAIEQRWPITCSKDTIESIKGYVEANESLHPSFSYKQFERENIKRIKVTPEPKDVWLSYERSDYVKEMGTPLPVALTTSLTRDQEAVPNLSDLMLEQSIKQREVAQKRTEQYKDMTEEDALKLVSENGTALLYLPTKFKNNEKVVSVAISNDEDAFRYAGPIARDNDRLARQAITADPDNIKYIGSTLRNDPDLYQMALERDRDLIKDIPLAMQKNPVIEKIVERDNRRKLGLTIVKSREGAELSK